MLSIETMDPDLAVTALPPVGEGSVSEDELCQDIYVNSSLEASFKSDLICTPDSITRDFSRDTLDSFVAPDTVTHHGLAPVPIEAMDSFPRKDIHVSYQMNGGHYKTGLAAGLGNSVGIGGSPSGWLGGLLGCLRPMWNVINSRQAEKQAATDPWEISFDAIHDLKWLGSGAQGAVFLGTYRDEFVALKKVNKIADTDIRHLKKLSHPNLVR